MEGPTRPARRSGQGSQTVSASRLGEGNGRMVAFTAMVLSHYNDHRGSCALTIGPLQVGLSPDPGPARDGVSVLTRGVPSLDLAFLDVASAHSSLGSSHLPGPGGLLCHPSPSLGFSETLLPPEVPLGLTSPTPFTGLWFLKTKSRTGSVLLTAFCLAVDSYWNMEMRGLLSAG